MEEGERCVKRTASSYFSLTAHSASERAVSEREKEKEAASEPDVSRPSPSSSFSNLPIRSSLRVPSPSSSSSGLPTPVEPPKKVKRVRFAEDTEDHIRDGIHADMRQVRAGVVKIVA